jgi:hypothetical protein
MRKIRIINGTYGYRRPGSVGVTPKSKRDPPFEVEDAQAARLVALKAAEYADVPVVSILPPKEDNRTETEKLLDKTRKELDAMAAKLGVDASNCRNKQEVAVLILSAQASEEEEGGEDEEDNGDESAESPDLTGGEDIVT